MKTRSTTRRLAQLGAGVLALTLALASCSASPEAEISGSTGASPTTAAASSAQGSTAGSSAPATGASESGSPAPQAPPAAEGTFTAVENTPGGAGIEQVPSPWFNSGSMSQIAQFRALFRAEPNLTDVTPDLAEKYEISDDHKTLTITLKQNLKWSDGAPLTADDVVWSMNSILRVAKANAIYVTAFKNIEGADAVKAGSDATLTGVTAEGNTITVKLVNPVGNIVPVLAQFMILPKHKLEKSDPLKMDTDPFWKDPVSSGPYKVGEFSQGNYVTLVPNENYEGSKPKIAKINIVSSADPVADAKAGKIDYFTTNDAEIIKSMKEVSSFTANPVDVLFYRYFVFNLSEADGPFANPKAREALKYAIDWQGLVTSLYPELGVVINSGVPEGNADHDAALAKTEFDVEKAKALLTEAGFDFNKQVRLRYYYSDQTSINLMTAVAQQLMDLGMKVEVLKFQGDATTELFTTRKYDIAFKGLSSFGFNEWYGEYTATPTFGQLIGEQPDFAAQVKALNESTGPEATKTALMALQKLEAEKMLKLPVYTLKQYVFIASKVQGTGGFGNPLYIYNNKLTDWTLG